MKTIILVALLLLAACAPEEVTMTKDQTQPENQESEATTALATFAGGCFWCMEGPFEELEGVSSVISGYAGGEEVEPSYKDVAGGNTGHREAVQIAYNPEKTTYQELLDVYWRQIDPTDEGGSFVDRGFQYTSAIFYNTEEEMQLAEESKQIVAERLGKEVVTPIIKFSTFYPAENYHQNYYKTNPIKYKYYRSRSGRDQYIESTWYKNNESLWEQTAEGEVFMKPSAEELKKTLTPIQYKVTQKDGTEKPFENEYWNNTEDGIYVDVVSGEPLFSSKDKYKSGTGWPSFTQPLVEENIVEKKDFKLLLPRTEIRSKNADSHVGHVFTDGPEPTGLRYCMNSAALRFIPAEDLEKEGYGEFTKLFSEA